METIRQYQGMTKVGSTCIPQRVRKKLPRRPRSLRYSMPAGEKLQLEAAWRDEMIDQVWPMGRFIDVEHNTRILIEACADNYLAWRGDRHYDLYDLSEYFYNGAKALVTAVVGKSSDVLVECPDMETAARCTADLDLIRSWLSDPDNWAVSLYPAPTPRIAECMVDMIRRFKTPANARLWANRVRQRVFRIAPTVLAQGLNQPNSAGMRAAAMVRTRSVRKAAVMVTSVLFANEPNLSRTSSEYAERVCSYQCAKAHLMADIEHWRAGDQRFESMKQAQTMAELFGCRRDAREVCAITWREIADNLDRVLPHAEVISAAYRGIRRRWHSRYLLPHLATLFATVGEAAGKRLVQIAARGQRSMERLYYNLPTARFSECQRERIAQAEDPEREMMLLKKWTGFL